MIGFGADSLIEALAGFVVVWLFTGSRLHSPTAERRAQQLVAASFFVLAVYVATESIRTLVGGTHPETSWVGVGLAAFTAPTMPLLAAAKRRVGNRLHSAAAVKEASQTVLCAYLSVALLVGLLANALAGWWWADPTAALVIAAVALREGRRVLARRGLLRCLLTISRTFTTTPSTTTLRTRGTRTQSGRPPTAACGSASRQRTGRDDADHGGLGSTRCLIG